MSCFLSCFRAPKNNKPKRQSFSRKPVNNDTCSAVAHTLPQQLRSQHSTQCRDKDESEGTTGANKNVTSEGVVENLEQEEEREIVENLEQVEERERIKEKVFPVNHRYHNCEGIDDDDDVGDDDYELGGDEEDCGLCDDDVDEKKSSCEVIGPEKTNHRYSNCEDSDDDDDVEMEVDDEDCELIDECGDDGKVVDGVEDEGHDQNNGSREVCTPEIESYSGSDEVNLGGTVFQKSKSHDQSQYVHSVLSPVENLTQWKEVNLRSVAPAKDRLNKEILDSDIENKVPADSESFVKAKKQGWSVDSKATPCYSAKRDVSVDASLSTWLVSSDNSTVEGPQESGSRLSNSSFSREERPILGALTVEDIKHLSATSTPRKSPSRSPDDTPIIGSVGSYWNSSKQRDYDTGYSRKSGCNVKGIPNTTSKYREDRKVNWHSTPFEVRLERALKGRT